MLIILILASLFCTDGPRLPDKLKDRTPADPLVGIWRYTTTDGTTEINGTVSVWKRGDSFLVQWSGATETEDTTAVSHATGHGMRVGNTLAISWTAGNSGGLSVFTIDAQGKELRGRWTARGSGTAREEVWVWLAGHSKGT